ncbi:MAG: haloacid dehalogenase-like hydrolase [Clostridia bacterium]|nr:haloacid dehalogenase-like hydrolase [Clostridia bacterium]
MQTKVIVFDFDGTISRVDKGFNCWNAVWKELNAVEVDKKYYNMYKAKQITYLEWCNAIEKEFVARNIKEEMLQDIGKKIPLMNNAEEFFKILKDNDIKAYILSGGIKNII